MSDDDMSTNVLPDRTQVLIAGGGPVGLAAAVELGQCGITCVVIEPRATVSHARPRCKTISIRSMEHLRRWGIADRLRERAPLPVAWSQDIVFCTSLIGHELSRFSGVLGLTPEDGRSAEAGQQAPQYVLEELLRDVVDELPTVTLATGRRSPPPTSSAVTAPAARCAPPLAPTTSASMRCDPTSGWCSTRLTCCN